MKQKNNPKISVVMSTYNEPLNWITESIDSILNQTFSDFEFIIINDNPKRKELTEFLKDYEKKDKRIILIKNKENIGLTKSLNKGLRLAKGSYIARMDADDISLPKRFKVQHKFMEKNQDIFLCGGGAEIIDIEGNKIKEFHPILSDKKIKKKLKYTNCIYHPTIFFKNEKKYFYRDKFSCAQDYDFYLNLLSHNKILINVPNLLIKYRKNPDSITSKKQLYQKILSYYARMFYRQRAKMGKDDYKTVNLKKDVQNEKIFLFFKYPLVFLKNYFFKFINFFQIKKLE